MSDRDEGTRVPGRRRATAGRSAMLVALLSTLAVSPAFGAFTCTGKISYLGLSPDGFVTVAVQGFGVWYICDQTRSHSGNGGIVFSPEGCRAWFASFLAAQKSDTPIQLFFNSPATGNNGPECTALGAWAHPNPAPYHMNLVN